MSACPSESRTAEKEPIQADSLVWISALSGLAVQIHGPVMTLWMGSQPTIILNDVRSVTELLQKNARDTSDRPRSIVGDEILSGNKRILLVGHTDRWRKLRKALHTQLQPQEAKLYEPAQEKAAKQVIADILSHPASALESVDVYGAAIALRIGYGREDKRECSG